MLAGERNAKNQMKIGAGIALFGLLCPFFWFRFFSGDYGFETLIYGIHSGIFIAIGLALVGNGWFNLKRGRAAIQAFTGGAGDDRKFR